MFLYAFGLLGLTILALITSVCIGSKNFGDRVLFCQYDIRAKQQFPVEEIPLDMCSDILIGFFAIDPALQTMVDSNDQAALAEVENKIFHVGVERNDLRFHLTLGQPGTTPPNKDLEPIVNDEAAITTFLGLLKGYVLERSYRGVNIYWDAGVGSDRKLVDFLGELHNTFSSLEQGGDGGQKRKWVITVTLSAYPVTGDLDKGIYDIRNFTDYLIVKAFNLHVDSRPIASYTHPQYLRMGDETKAQLYYLHQTYSVNWWRSHGVPPEKLVVGYPTYARALTIPPAGAPQDSLYPQSIYNKTIIVSRAEACRIYREGIDTWTQDYDRRWMAMYMTRPHGTNQEWLFYGGKSSIKRRCDWLLKHNYSGLMVWTLDMDDSKGFCGHSTFPITRQGSYCLDRGGVSGFETRPATTNDVEDSKTDYFIWIGVIWFSILWSVLFYWYLVPHHWRMCDGEHKNIEGVLQGN